MPKGKPARWIMRKEGKEPLRVRMDHGRPVRIHDKYNEKKHRESRKPSLVSY